MRILNYRTGFAANSSSMHSPMIVENINDVIEERFGNGFYMADFIIKEKNSILEYLAAQINTMMNDPIDSMCSGYKDDPAMNKIIIDGLLGTELFNDTDSYASDRLCIQSDMAGWILPHKKSCFRRLPDSEFIKDLKKYLLESNVVISGFNLNYHSKDQEETKNDYSKFRKKRSHVFHSIATNTYKQSWFSYKENGVWRLFNAFDGTKIRLSFDDKRITYAITPELIDVIISDRCENNCSYCYRNCKPNSPVASIDDIERILHLISLTNVSEVAIGGGDILIYPDLDKLLDIIMKYSNYEILFSTTISYISINKHNDCYNLLRKISSIFKSVAISVSCSKDIKKFMKKYLKIFEDNKCVISFQIIPELISSLNELRRITRYATTIITDFGNVKITLLGYKNAINNMNSDNNYSVAISKFHSEEYLEKFKKVILRNIDDYQCDTQFLKNFPEIQNNLTEETYELEEGTFSCCINAIDQKLYKSSYQLDHSYMLYNKNFEYQGFTPYHKNLQLLHKVKENPIIKGFRRVRNKYDDQISLYSNKFLSKTDGS